MLDRLWPIPVTQLPQLHYDFTIVDGRVGMLRCLRDVNDARRPHYWCWCIVAPPHTETFVYVPHDPARPLLAAEPKCSVERLQELCNQVLACCPVPYVYVVRSKLRAPSQYFLADVQDPELLGRR